MGLLATPPPLRFFCNFLGTGTFPGYSDRPGILVFEWAVGVFPSVVFLTPYHLTWTFYCYFCLVPFRSKKWYVAPSPSFLVEPFFWW